VRDARRHARSGRPKWKHQATILPLIEEELTLTPDQRAELDKRLDAYAVDKNGGRLAADAIADIRRRL
jgi:hypothetical protein